MITTVKRGDKLKTLVEYLGIPKGTIVTVEYQEYPGYGCRCNLPTGIRSPLGDLDSVHYSAHEVEPVKQPKPRPKQDREPTYFIEPEYGACLYWCEGDTVKCCAYDAAPGYMNYYGIIQSSTWPTRASLLAALDTADLVPVVGFDKHLGQYWGTVTPGYVAPAPTRPPTTPRKPLKNEVWLCENGQQRIVYTDFEEWYRDKQSHGPISGINAEYYHDTGKRSDRLDGFDLVRLVKYADGTPVEPVSQPAPVKQSTGNTLDRTRIRERMEWVVAELGGTVTWENCNETIRL